MVNLNSYISELFLSFVLFGQILFGSYGVWKLCKTIAVVVSANWWEKEIWDMFGVFFLGHWGLRRLLTDYGFEGHPLRKDFPLIGFEEVQYDLTTKKVELASINLFQDIKLFQKETNSILY